MAGGNGTRVWGNGSARENAVQWKAGAEEDERVRGEARRSRPRRTPVVVWRAQETDSESSSGKELSVKGRRRRTRVRRVQDPEDDVSDYVEPLNDSDAKPVFVPGEARTTAADAEEDEEGGQQTVEITKPPPPFCNATGSPAKELDQLTMAPLEWFENAYKHQGYQSKASLPVDDRRKRKICTHCYSAETSVWRFGEKSSGILCEDCAMSFSKTHELPPRPLCWCCGKAHVGVCPDEGSVLFLLERRSTVMKDQHMPADEKTEILRKIALALSSAHASSATAVRQSHRISRKSERLRDHSPESADSSAVSSGSQSLLPAQEHPRGTDAAAAQQNRPPCSDTETNAEQPSGTWDNHHLAAEDAAEGGQVVLDFVDHEDDAPVAFSLSSCVICQEPGHNMGRCRLRADVNLIRRRHVQVASNTAIPAAKREEILSRLAIYMNNRVVIRSA